MSEENINLTAPIHAATKKGKAVAAMEVFMDGDKETVQQIGEKTHQLEDAIKDITVTGGASTANAVSYNNETSGMTAVTAQGAIDELVTNVYHKTLTKSGWSASGTNFVQTLSISGFTANMKPPIVDVIPASILDVDLWGKIWKVETINGGLKFTANEKPSSNLNIVVTKGV